MSPKRRTFHCVLVALSAILMAFTSRRGSLEANAIGSCRSYCSAQTMFKRNDWEVDGSLQHPTGNEAGAGVLEHCQDLRDLHACLDNNGDSIELIDSAFAAAHGPGGTPKHGYLFLEIKSIGGKPIDWKQEYALCAIPAVYGRTGRRSFIVKNDGFVWSKDFGKPSGFVADFPADPVANGWQNADERPSKFKPEYALWVLGALIFAVVVLVPLLVRVEHAKNLFHWLLAAIPIMVIITGVWSLLWYVAHRVFEI